MGGSPAFDQLRASPRRAPRAAAVRILLNGDARDPRHARSPASTGAHGATRGLGCAADCFMGESPGRDPERGGTIMRLNRRDWLGATGVGLLAPGSGQPGRSGPPVRAKDRLTITGLTVTPIALPDPPLLASSGCHGPYFLRNVVELKTDGGIVGLGETHGGEGVTAALEKARDVVVGQNALAYRKFARELQALGMAVLRGDRAGLPGRLRPRDGPAPLRAARRPGARLGRVRRVPVLPIRRRPSGDPGRPAPGRLAGPRRSGPRRLGRGPLARGDGRDGRAVPRPLGLPRLQAQGRGPRARGRARQPRSPWPSGSGPTPGCGSTPTRAGRPPRPSGSARRSRSCRWNTTRTPCAGQAAMAEVREATGLKMSTNMCVTRFEHIGEALRRPSDRRPALRPPLLRRVRRLPGAGPDRPRRRLDAQPAQQQPRRHHHGGDDPPGRVDPRADLRQRHPLPLARRRAPTSSRARSSRSRTARWPCRPGPGLGVALDPDKLARAHEVYKKCGMRGRDDRSLMKRLEPGWTGELL